MNFNSYCAFMKTSDNELNLFKGMIKGDFPFWQRLVFLLLMLGFYAFVVYMLIKSIGPVGTGTSLAIRWVYALLGKKPP